MSFIGKYVSLDNIDWEITKLVCDRTNTYEVYDMNSDTLRTTVITPNSNICKPFDWFSGTFVDLQVADCPDLDNLEDFDSL